MKLYLLISTVILVLVKYTNANTENNTEIPLNSTDTILPIKLVNINVNDTAENILDVSLIFF